MWPSVYGVRLVVDGPMLVLARIVGLVLGILAGAMLA